MLPVGAVEGEGVGHTLSQRGESERVLRDLHGGEGKTRADRDLKQVREERGWSRQPGVEMFQVELQGVPQVPVGASRWPLCSSFLAPSWLLFANCVASPNPQSLLGSGSGFWFDCAQEGTALLCPWRLRGCRNPTHTAGVGLGVTFWDCTCGGAS